MKQNFIVALKNATRIPGKIIPGKELGHYHKKEHALHDVPKFMAKLGLSRLDIGIFLNGEQLT